MKWSRIACELYSLHETSTIKQQIANVVKSKGYVLKIRLKVRLLWGILAGAPRSSIGMDGSRVVFVLEDRKAGRQAGCGSNAQIRVNIQRERYIWHVGRTGTNIGALERIEGVRGRKEREGAEMVCVCA